MHFSCTPLKSVYPLKRARKKASRRDLRAGISAGRDTRERRGRELSLKNKHQVSSRKWVVLGNRPSQNAMLWSRPVQWKTGVHTCTKKNGKREEQREVGNTPSIWRVRSIKKNGGSYSLN